MTQSQALEDLRVLGKLPDAFVIGSSLDETSDGLRLVSELRARATTRNAVIVVQDCGEIPSPSSLALDLGANAVLRPGFDADELEVRLNRLLARKLESDQLRNNVDNSLAMAIKDPLTGLHNRRYAQGYLEQIEREARDLDQPYAIMLLDLDKFKQVNDRYGHVAGDEVLVEVAARLRARLREMDLLARFGGEEFLIALPGVERQEAETMAERLRCAIGDTPIQIASCGQAIPVTMSIGVAVATEKQTAQLDETAHALLQAADQALYVSKADGRNQVTFVSDAA